jgi:hypothetical protein
MNMIVRFDTFSTAPLSGGAVFKQIPTMVEDMIFNR